MKNRKLKIFTAVSGGSDENPHMRFGIGRNWNFGNFQEEVIALRDLLNDTIEGPPFSGCQSTRPCPMISPQRTRVPGSP